MLSPISVKADDEEDIKKISAVYKRTNALNAQTEYQEKVKNKMLVYYTNLMENYSTLTSEEKKTTLSGLESGYENYLSDFFHTEIESTKHIMSIGMLSDAHITTTGGGVEKFKTTLKDLLSINPDLAVACVLGDLSDNGVCVADPAKGDLDNYYDMLDSIDFQNTKGEDIPILSIMGNHDVRGPEYIPANYQPAVDMYLEREGVDSLCWDTWINGYHFIMLNTAKYGRDEGYLSADNIRWLDAKLSEKEEEGKPQFVLIHQPKDDVYTMSGAPYTFEEVIARHPSAIVSSGHTHAGFEWNEVVQNGKGNFINQPALYGNSGTYSGACYFFVDVYEGGVIFRGRDLYAQKWIPVGDVAVYLDDCNRTLAYFDEDGELLNSFSTKLGETFSKPADPTKEEDAGYTYEFVGWDSTGDGRADSLPAKVQQSLQLTAVYEAKAKSFSYAFYSANKASKLSDGTLSYGATLSAPAVDNLLGWDTNGDGVAEDLPKKMESAFEAVAILKESGKPVYSFVDASGKVYGKAQATDYSEVKVPADPTVASDTVFLGWDVNGDRVPDTLPTSGAISADVTFTAVLYKKAGTYSLWDGVSASTTLKDANQNNIIYLKKTANASYAASPTGKALKVEWNPYGLSGQNKKQSASPMLRFKVPTLSVTAKGVAFWVNMTSSKADQYLFTLSMSGTKVGAKPVYFLSDEGKLYTDSTAANKKSPEDGFCGWVIIPTSTFSNNKVVADDYIEFSFDVAQNDVAGKKTMYFGQMLAYTGDVETVATQLMQSYYTYVDYDGTVLKEGALANGAAFPTVENPKGLQTQEFSNTFVGWDINGDGVADELPTKAGGAVTLKAVYEQTVNQYTYKFVDEDGEVVLEKTVDYNSLILPPFNTTVVTPESTKALVYENYVEGQRITDDITINVKYETTPNYYTYTFKNPFATEQVVLSEKVAYGTVIEAPAAPVRESTAAVDYVFSGWKGYTEGMKVTGNVEFVATFEEVAKKYTVTFLADDGKTVVSSSELAYNADITAPAAPAKEGYTFDKWEGYTAGMKVSGDASFVAVYKKNASSGSNNNSGSSSKGGCGSSIAASAPIALGFVLATAGLISRRKQESDNE